MLFDSLPHVRHRWRRPRPRASEPAESPAEPVCPTALRGFRRLLRQPCQYKDNESVQVRCPVCRVPLSPRLGPLGPYFHCQCRAR